MFPLLHSTPCSTVSFPYPKVYTHFAFHEASSVWYTNILLCSSKCIIVRVDIINHAQVVYTIVCISGLIPRARSLGMRLMYILQFVYYHSTCMQFSLVLKDTTDLCDDSTCRGWQSVQHTAVWAGHPRVQHRLGHTGLHCHRWDMVCIPHTPHLWPGRAIARVACDKSR